MKFPRGVRWIPWAAALSVVAATLLAYLPARAAIPWVNSPGTKGGGTNTEVTPPAPPPVPPTNSSTPPPPPQPPPNPPSPPPSGPPPGPPTPPPPHNTPEPATLVSALLGAGVLGLFTLRRRNRKGQEKSS
jgi:hypothetical protein